MTSAERSLVIAAHLLAVKFICQLCLAMVVWRMAATIDFDVLQKAYFQWDKPVPYKIDDEHEILIYPILFKDSEIFYNSCAVISVDKDTIADAEIISMSYLDFMVDKLIGVDDMYAYELYNIAKYCLHWDDILIGTYQNGKHWLQNKDGDIKITAKKFNDIRRIILYQNIVEYDDSYVNPELKQAMEETDALKNRDIDMPNNERRMSIITAHSGIPRKAQMEMTLREHSMLFREVSGEVDHYTTWPIALYAGESKKMEHWIYHKKKGKFDGYITDTKQIISSIGGNPNAIQQVDNADSLENMYDNFNK